MLSRRENQTTELEQRWNQQQKTTWEREIPGTKIQRLKESTEWNMLVATKNTPTTLINGRKEAVCPRSRASRIVVHSFGSPYFMFCTCVRVLYWLGGGSQFCSWKWTTKTTLVVSELVERIAIPLIEFTFVQHQNFLFMDTCRTIPQ